MRNLLHILTRPDDPLADKIIALQRDQPDCQLTVADLTAPDPDYDALLEKIFTADSIQVW